MSEGKHVVFFSRLYYPHVGGIEKHVYKISQELLKRGYSISIITETFKAGQKKEETIEGVKIFRIPVHAVSEKHKKWVIWKWLKRHSSIFQNAEILHIHDVFYWYIPFIVRKNKPQIHITFHGYESDNPTISAILQRKLATHIARTTIHIGGFMQKWYHVKPTAILYGAADDVVKNQIEERNHKAIYLGRLKEDVGIMTYLHGLKILKDSGLTITLDIYGDGPKRQDAEKFVQENNLSVHFKGFIPDASKKLHTYSYAFISRYLGFIESMQSKTPIFAVYDTDMKKDYIMVHPQVENMFVAGSAEELADQMLNAIKYLSKTRRKVEESYVWARKQTWEMVVDVYEQMWRR